MNPKIEIFKPGKFIAMDGQEYEFTEADLKATAAGYDPAKHEAPLVVGHPRDDAPAYGWGKALEFADGALVLTPDQVDPAFAELHKAGRFKKRSASFYAPTDPRNPVPGIWYLRHLGFLGAQPPAVKGLKAANFAADDAAVEFGDWNDQTIARMFRKLKNFFIEQFGKEKADQVIDEWELEDIQREALRPETPAEPIPAFADPNRKEQTMTPEELQQREADLATRAAAFAEGQARLAALETENAELKAQAAAQQRAARDAEFAAFCDSLPTRISPAMRPAVLATLHTLHGQAPVEFAEGDKTVTKTPLEIYQEQLKALPEVVSFGEHATHDKAGKQTVDGTDATAIARAAVAFVEEEAKAGRTITVTEAVAHVTRK